jgi:hypothetical protein
MECILEIYVGIDAVILDAIKLASDKWDGIVAFAYKLIDFDIVSTDANIWSCSL